MSRYSLIGAVLRSDGDVPAARQVAARVSAAIAKEPFRGVSFIRIPARGALLRAAAGLAVAASVAFGAVLLVQQLRLAGSGGSRGGPGAGGDVPPVQPVSDELDGSMSPRRST